MSVVFTLVCIFGELLYLHVNVLIKTEYTKASETPVVPSTFMRFRSVHIYRPANHSLTLHRSGSGALRIKGPAVAVII